MQRVFLVLIVAFILLGSYVYLHLGAYKSAEIHGPVKQSFHLLYREHIGPYHEILSTLTEVERWALENKIPCPQTFGLFLDDPEKVDPERLRSQVGCVINEPLSRPGTDESAPKYLALTERNYLYLTFNGSPSLGPFKAYRQAQKWFEQNRQKLEGPVLEIYSLVNGDELTTHYYFPLSP